MATTASHSLRTERATLSNGLPLIHSVARANPSVVARVLLRSAASRERPEEQGLASMVGRMLRQGTRSMTKADLALDLDGMGAGLSVDVGYALTAISIKCLSSDFEHALEILTSVLRHPTFPADELERMRGQVLTDLKEIDDNTRVVAERTWREAAYPEGHRYQRLTTGTVESVTSFTTEDLRRFHDQHFVSSQASLIVVGDISFDVARKVGERLLGDWERGDLMSVADTLPATESPREQAVEVAMSGKAQADVVLGTPALSRLDPDYYALAFANHILGRMYFMGRFGEKVRDEQGLAYYAHSELHGGFGRGPWVVRAGVNPANLDRAVSSIRTEQDRFLADGATEAEHADAIQSLIGGLPRQLESNEGAAGVIGEIEVYGLGADYLDRYPDIIRSLTHDQVLTAARAHLRPDTMVTAIAGPPRTG